MKTIFAILIFLPGLFFSQVTIGKNGALPTTPSVLLEFGNDGDKGLILPYVNGEPADSVPGTVIFNAIQKRVEIKTSAGWIDLSGNTGNVDLSLQDTISENPLAKVIIGASSSTAPGILVLESTDKAFVMPKVNNYTDIVAPSPGMIVYLTSSKKIAVYNGSTWSFWKP